MNYKILARLSGIFFLTAFVGGIFGLTLLKPALESTVDLNAIAENDTEVILGALGILFMAISCALIAVPMYPILRKRNEAMALTSIVFRTLESMAHIIYVISMITLVRLSQMYVDAGSPSDDPSYQTIAAVLHELQGIQLSVALFAIGAFMYYFLFYQTKLIPKWLAAWGMIGVAVNFVNVISLTLGLYGSESIIAIISEIPLASNELILAFWLIIKGYNSDALKALDNE